MFNQNARSGCFLISLISTKCLRNIYFFKYKVNHKVNLSLTAFKSSIRKYRLTNCPPETSFSIASLDMEKRVFLSFTLGRKKVFSIETTSIVLKKRFKYTFMVSPLSLVGHIPNIGNYHFFYFENCQHRMLTPVSIKRL